ncbi:MAG: ABC transporter ATP-binding protein [Spartobacteria bacterium]|nr:ABC transporter ATP-binding protein [Spartobacteria bacterium]
MKNRTLTEPRNMKASAVGAHQPVHTKSSTRCQYQTKNGTQSNQCGQPPARFLFARWFAIVLFLFVDHSIPVFVSTLVYHRLMNKEKTPLLEIQQLCVDYGHGTHSFRAVNHVDLIVPKGQCVGLAGESGCGKSSLALAVMKLLPSSGILKLDGQDIPHRGSALRDYRKRVQIVFQDPFESLNPRMRIGSALMEVFRVHERVSKDEAWNKACAMLNTVQLPSSAMERYPHEFSGGQRQRIGIARALAMKPEILIADEPVSALDVSVQAQIISLLKTLKVEYGLSILLIAHDLAAMRVICDTMYVMNNGQIVESGPTQNLFDHPAHPYTRKLLAAAPDVEAALARRNAVHDFR